MRYSPLGQRRWIHPLVFLVLLVGLAACASSRSGEPRPRESVAQSLAQSILTGEPCLVPCWEKLTPGHSSQELALQRMGELSFLEGDHPELTDVGYFDPSSGDRIAGVRATFTCSNDDRVECVSLTFANSVLKRVQLNLGGWISLGDMILAIGEPDFIRPIQAGPESPRCSIRLLWTTERVIGVLIDIDEMETSCQSVRAGEVPGADRGVGFVIIESEGWVKSVPSTSIDIPWPGR